MSKIKPAEKGKEIEFTSYLNSRQNFSLSFEIEEEKKDGIVTGFKEGVTEENLTLTNEQLLVNKPEI